MKDKTVQENEGGTMMVLNISRWNNSLFTNSELYTEVNITAE